MRDTCWGPSPSSGRRVRRERAGVLFGAEMRAHVPDVRVLGDRSFFFADSAHFNRLVGPMQTHNQSPPHNTTPHPHPLQVAMPLTLTLPAFKQCAKAAAAEQNNLRQDIRATKAVWRPRHKMIVMAGGWEYAHNAVIFNADGDRNAKQKTCKELCACDDGTPINIPKRLHELNQVIRTSKHTQRFHIHAHNLNEPGMNAAHHALMLEDVDAINELEDGDKNGFVTWNLATQEVTSTKGENAFLQCSNTSRDRHALRVDIMEYVRAANSIAPPAVTPP